MTNARPEPATTGGPAAPTALGRVSGRLVRLGFTRSGQAAGLLVSPRLGLWDEAANAPRDDAAAAVVSALGRCADPDLAAAALFELAERLGPRAGELMAALGRSATLRARLLGVLGASVALGEHLAGHPGDWTALNSDGEIDSPSFLRRLTAAVRADPDDPVTGSRGRCAQITGPEAIVGLRGAYRRELLVIAGHDLSGEASVEDVTAALAHLAGATLQAALAVAAAEVQSGRGPGFDLAVVALGKAGGLELNYVSDVDAVFVAEPHGLQDVEAALAAATRLAARLMQICGLAVWEVDAGLRPEGKDGPLVRTLASHVAYYRRWASTWEFQALLKARPVAGHLPLGQSYVEAVRPLVWTAAERPGFVADVQAMRRRVVAQLPAAVAAREIKLGPGGLRDVEFAIQLLQLVHGRGDESLQVPGTLAALRALRDGGFIGRDDAVSLADAYRFLRATEHRVQLMRLRRTHLVPDDPSAVYRLARSLGFRADHRGDARDVWLAEWALHAREVRRLHEKLFYRPLLDAVARVPSEQLRLTPVEAQRRLAALGFAYPRRALQHIEALTAGLSRRAAIQRALLPVLLADFSTAPDPDAGLLRYRRLSDAAGQAPWYLRMLRDEGEVADRLAYLLGTSQYLADVLVAAPDTLALLADDASLRPRSGAEIEATMRETAGRQGSLEAKVRAVRAVRRTELVRIASADLLGRADADAIALGLSATMDATIAVALDAVIDSAVRAAELAAPPGRVAVIAMGRLGGGELGYGSDADVLFVHEPTGGSDTEVAARFATDVAASLRALLAAPGGDPAVLIDANLRPEGRDGPLVRSLASYAAYYQRWSSTWERQALLRARPAAGDVDLGDRFIALVDRLRYRRDGLDLAATLEIRRLKARIDGERLPRGADPATHTKLGRGGLGDVEWTVQLVQLQHGHAVPALRTTSTVAALGAAAESGLIEPKAVETLLSAWRLATRVRNAILLVTGRPDDQLPAAGATLVGVGRALGYPAGFDPGRLEDDYRRVTRRARRHVERIFYDPQALS
ncbi:MAG: bifunctional [glutamine synthetase] adenylyltransferase/[glutamine synthetase]-adenylyl-L-tyrosine phosphorylase [Actinomycetota bacterium]|nr:bifunctional [glutamine synthetase] adenylyltransferase/[glutamine synthetase]-adenylyl-L-tyrosine phosphorylase [Actinomycetota bacterium]